MENIMYKPVIGVVMCRNRLKGHQTQTLQEKYLNAIVNAGGLPIALPHALAEPELLNAVVDKLDGIYLPGSPSNVQPHLYGENGDEPDADPGRDLLSMALIYAALERRIPIFAICRGLQELVVATGGTLYRRLFEQPELLEHREDPELPVEQQYAPSHQVEVQEGGLLSQLIPGCNTFWVNSLHGQGAKTLGSRLRVEARSPPGFDKGWVTVQDASAQGCMRYLQPANGERILDLCAAPGGKTTHILEVAPQASLMAVDIDQQRLSRVYDNLKRLGMKAEVKQGDGRYPEQWCGDEQFDRILLDAPCSATGVIRRHPDIKWLRRDRDIAELAQLQAEILDATWAHLKPGGTLVYATCSILPEENSQQIAAFLTRTRDAELHETGTPETPGQQNLPGAEEGDGFFYAKLIKKRN